MCHTDVVAGKRQQDAAPPTPSEELRRDVAVYVAAGGDEAVQRVATAVHGLSRRLTQWYDRQLADLDLSAGEWAVLSRLVRDTTGKGCTPSELADAANVAPSSMTHRLDRMVERGLVTRATDPENRVRVRVRLSDDGWELFRTAIRESNMLESDVLGCLTPEQRRELARLLELAIAGLDTLDG
jgi:DNA-binding MarR family transcriptional regulator